MNRKSSRPIHSTPSLIGWGRPAVTFRRFCRKGYAVFVSLHREVRIGVLTVGMLASVHLPKVQAMMPTMGPDTEGEADDTELSEVTVAGTLSPLTALQSARIVGVITCQQIEASAAQSVNDLLKLAVGVDVRQRGGFGIQSDISIDGGTFDQITLLLNGVNISSPHTGHLAADFPVSLSDIERIEILEGAASRVYGASAFGGAINIVTKGEDRPTPIPGQSPPTRSLSRQGGACWSNDSLSQARGISSLTGGVQGGSYTTFGADVRVSLRQPLPSLTEGVGSGAVSAQYLRSDGATFNSDFRRGSAYLRGILDAEDFRIDLQAGYSEKAYGANTFYSAAYPNQWEHNRRFIFSAGIETKGRIRVRPEVYWNRLYDHFQLIRSTPTGENFHRSDVYGTRVTAGLSWVAGRTTIGAEVREEGIYSSNLGKPLNENRSSHYTHHDARTNLSLSAEHTLLLSRFTASAGLLAHYNARFDSHLRLYPGIDLAYTPPTSNHSSPSMESTVQSSSQGEAVKPGAKSKVLRRTKRQSRAQSPKLFAERSGKAERKAQSSKFKVQSSKLNVRFFLSYNKGFRLPTFTDLYYKSPTHEGNQGMRAEESHSVQAGATLKMTRGESVSSAFTLKAFYHRGHNLIDWVMYAPDDVYHSANFDLDNIGFQAQTTINVLPPQRGAGRPLTLHLSYAFLHQHRRDDTPVYKSNYAMEYLRHKLVATFDHPVWSHLTASWSLRWQERMGSYLLYEDAQSTGRLVPYDPYATLDLKLRWTARHYELWAEATNLTNRHYYDLGNIPQPGIVILGGIRLRL